MISDFHVHTTFSADSKADMEEYVKRAISKKIQRVCFTDHVDLNKNDNGYNFYAPDRYFAIFNKLKEKYKDSIELYSGIEFGEPHVYTDIFKQLSVLPYDYIIGSIHWIGNFFPCEEVRAKYSAKEFYTWYWEEVLKTVKHGGFDCLGHIDFPKRYYGEIYYSENDVKEIFKILLDKNMVIEINTSSLRKGCSETMPGREILEIYKDCGGKYVTIGSDSHFTDDIGADADAAKKLIKDFSLREVIYENRKMIILEN
ncbi:MAG: histidinol-phosphatase HisJ family protein [Ruminococcaceae bacterium]|nr:histidinol-phosphatase HisJ family protein [Oscillospiraceae bacterium]